MARPPMKKQSELIANAHWGYIAKSGGATQTRFLFSVYDFVWVAWYMFFETDSMTIDVPAKLNGTHTVFGTPFGGGTAFQPFKPLQVDELAKGNAPYGNRSALALLSVRYPTDKNLLTMGLTIFLERPQNINFRLFSRNPWELPAHYERGVVNLLQVEEWSASRPLNDPRFQDAGLGKSKLRVPGTLKDI